MSSQNSEPSPKTKDVYKGKAIKAADPPGYKENAESESLPTHSRYLINEDTLSVDSDTDSDEYNTDIDALIPLKSYQDILQDIKKYTATIPEGARRKYKTDTPMKVDATNQTNEKMEENTAENATTENIPKHDTNQRVKIITRNNNGQIRTMFANVIQSSSNRNVLLSDVVVMWKRTLSTTGAAGTHPVPVGFKRISNSGTLERHLGYGVWQYQRRLPKLRVGTKHIVRIISFNSTPHN